MRKTGTCSPRFHYVVSTAKQKPPHMHKHHPEQHFSVNKQMVNATPYTIELWMREVAKHETSVRPWSNVTWSTMIFECALAFDHQLLCTIIDHHQISFTLNLFKFFMIVRHSFSLLITRIIVHYTIIDYHAPFDQDLRVAEGDSGFLSA